MSKTKVKIVKIGASCCMACGMLGYCHGISLVLKIEFQGTHALIHAPSALRYMVHAAADKKATPVDFVRH